MNTEEYERNHIMRRIKTCPPSPLSSPRLGESLPIEGEEYNVRFTFWGEGNAVFDN